MKGRYGTKFKILVVIGDQCHSTMLICAVAVSMNPSTTKKTLFNVQ